MLTFLVRRLLGGAITVWIITVIVFSLFFVLPVGDPAQRLAGKNPSPEQVATIRKEWGFDRSKITQYRILMGRVLTGELESPVAHVKVVPLILAGIPVTVSLAAFAAVIWVSVGVLVGIKGALAPGSFLDRSLMIAALCGVSLPMAWLSIYSLKMMTDVFPVFPAGGYQSIAEGGIFGWAFHILLPAATLSIVFAGVYARMTRSNIRTALAEEHVKTAVAKGVPWNRVFVHHVVRTGLIPIIVMLGLDIGALLGGAIFTESIFGLPGLGGAMMNGIATFDATIIIVGAIFASSFVVVANILVDIAQAAIDPRIRLA